MGLKRIIPPNESPISLTLAKEHLRATHDEEDATIQLYIDAAVESLDGAGGMLGRALMPQTWELALDAFPCGDIAVPLPPLQSVVWIKYFNPAGTETTLAADQYLVDTHNEPGRISPVDFWPSTECRINAVRVRFLAGYASAAAMPQQLRAALLLRIGSAFESRQDVGEGIAFASNPTFDLLTFPFRVLRL